MTELSQHVEAVGIVGTGRMARALGALMVRRGVHVAAIAGRSPKATAQAVQFIGAGMPLELRELPRYVQRIVIAVTDSAIPTVAAQLLDADLQDSIVLHTSGAAGPEALGILRANRNSVGVLHPLQTVPCPERGVAALAAASYAFAGDPEAVGWAATLIATLGGKPLHVDSQRWSHYHAGAVMACNYQMAMVDAALELMEFAGIGRGAALLALGPILRETMNNILELGPANALTGPIQRGDAETIRRHLNALEDAAADTRQLYRSAGLRTLPLAESTGLPTIAAQEIEATLRTQDI